MISYEEATSRCWAEVNLSRLVQNYRNALQHLKPPTQLICVLKADAYGLGAPTVAQRLWQEGQRMFAVASYNEAAEIRKLLPACEGLILGLCGDAQLVHAIKAGMLLTVFSQRYAEAVIRAAHDTGVKARVHVKLETGLNRLGFEPEEAVNAMIHMADSDCIELEGLFTHLALRNQESDRQQIDYLTGNALTYDNIILQYCDWEPFDENGYLNIDVLSGGSGKYITKGKAIDVTWKKDVINTEDRFANENFGVTHYYDADGNEITLNQGKTWVCIVLYPEDVQLYADAASFQAK